MKQFLRDHNVRAFTSRHPALIGFVACLLIIFGTIAYVWITAAQTRHALCALRGDLETRVQSSRNFLHEHPNGIPGISVKTINTDIANRQRTVHALRSLSCG